MSLRPVDVLQAWGLSDPPERGAVVLAYRRRAQRLHPDRAGNTPEANIAFMTLQEEYRLLLDYSSAPHTFGTQDNKSSEPAGPDKASPRSPIEKSAALHGAWRIPAANLTLRLILPLRVLWSGGEATVRYLRGVPCGCAAGCHVCHGTAVLLERIRLKLFCPPLPSPDHRVRLAGMGHKGDDGTSGDVFVEVYWRSWRGWSWQENRLVTVVFHPRGAPWLYVRSPAGGVARLPANGVLSWTSSSGMVARLFPVVVSCWSWAFLVQAFLACLWSYSRTSPWWKKPTAALVGGWSYFRETRCFTNTP